MARHFITLVKQEAEAVASFVPRLECAAAWKKGDGQRRCLFGGREGGEQRRVYTDAESLSGVQSDTL